MSGQDRELITGTQVSGGSETQAIIDLATQLQPVEIAGQGHIKRVALPPNWKLQEEDDEDLLPAPTRKNGNVILNDLESFINYVNLHKIEDSTAIYCSASYSTGKVEFKAIMNDHKGAPDGQQWQDFSARFTPVFSEEWKLWTMQDKETFSQIRFATFLEEQMADIPTVEGMPTSNDLLQMALAFEANQDMRFKSSVRLQNGGVQMNFVQDDDNQTLQKMEMFNKIAIGIPVFWNSDAYRIDARLRYRVRDGAVTFWYELIRPDKVLEDATKTMIEKIRAETSLAFFFGHI